MEDIASGGDSVAGVGIIWRCLYSCVLCWLRPQVGLKTEIWHSLSIWPGLSHSMMTSEYLVALGVKTNVCVIQTECITFYDLTLDIIQCHFCCILLATSQSLKLAQIKREEHTVLPFIGGISMTCLKLPQEFSPEYCREQFTEPMKLEVFSCSKVQLVYKQFLKVKDFS